MENTELCGKPESDCQVWRTYWVMAFVGSSAAFAAPCQTANHSSSASARPPHARLKFFNDDKPLLFPLTCPSVKGTQRMSEKGYIQQL